MMGIKERHFPSLPDDVSLEELVPKDNFYRRLQGALDLSFVRDLVKDRYAFGGRPSIDPVVFFGLQLILFFEGLRSERQLMEVVADRLSLRWFVRYPETEEAGASSGPAPTDRTWRSDQPHSGPSLESLLVAKEGIFQHAGSF
jgi:hypothetical protein